MSVVLGLWGGVWALDASAAGNRRQEVWGDAYSQVSPSLSVVEPKIAGREPRVETWLGIAGGLQRFGILARDEFKVPVGEYRKAFLTQREEDSARRQRYTLSHVQWELGYGLERVAVDYGKKSVEDFIHEFRLGIDYRPPVRAQFDVGARLGTIPEDSVRFGGIQLGFGYTYVFPPTLMQVLMEDLSEAVDDDEDEPSEGVTPPASAASPPEALAPSRKSGSRKKKAEILDEELASDTLADGKILRPAVWGRFAVDYSGVLALQVGEDAALRRKALQFQLGYRSGLTWEASVLASFSSFEAAPTSVLGAMALTNRSTSLVSGIAANGFAPYSWLATQLQDLSLTAQGRLDVSTRTRLGLDLTYQDYGAGGLGATFSVHPSGSYQLSRAWRLGGDVDLILGDFGAAVIFSVGAKVSL